jgi:hypothetical protein
MKQFLKQIIKRSPLSGMVRRLVDGSRRRELERWEQAGKPLPPPHVVQQRVLRDYAGRYGSRILVETGTYLGDMVEAMSADFEKIYSIELSAELYARAKKRFRWTKNVEIIHGDSGTELGILLQTIRQPTLFWLDGHHSGGLTAKGDNDTPILAELKCILDAENRGHVIIIDDARLFGTDPAYPSLSELAIFIKARRPDLDIVVADDSIRITPKR